VQLGRVAGGDDPVEDRQLDHKAITVKELCTRYLADLKAGLILGKGGRPKKASTIVTDTGRIERHIIPLIGTRRVKDLTKTDINKVLKDIMAGKTRVSVKTKKAARKGYRPRRRWNGHAYRWSPRRHTYLRRRGRDHREQSGTWHPQAKGQRAKASTVGGGVSNFG
jgi:Phage integrase, N-terminal SAM-like domain